MELVTVFALLVVVLAIILAMTSIKIVPQAQVWVVERFGRFSGVLQPGLNFLVPFFNRIGHKVTVLERQLPTSQLSVITKDNVEIKMHVSVFYRVTAAEKAVYRIKDVDGAVSMMTTGTIRAACGELDFDEVQSKRTHLNDRIRHDLQEATAEWGINITRTEILDVEVDETTRGAMAKLLNAERERRSTVRLAEGQREAAQLAADAQLYTAQKQAEAIRVRADADAYATRILAEAIAAGGQPAIDYEIMKRKVDAMQALAGSTNSKVRIMPSNVTGVLGSIETMTEIVKARG
ncbi:MAG: SPFH/Band 7/PHB domain protein [Hyphomicrobiales bacterium]|nr:SPFH/Band 7/PHB domain protein [Hyphomicrobiales bacterium]